MSPSQKDFLIIIYFLLFFFAINITYSMKFPEVFFFPFMPSFSFSLISDKNNSIDMYARIEMPYDEDYTDNFYLNWILKITVDNQKLYYSLRFCVTSNGDVYFTDISDGLFQRYLEPPPLIFPQKIKYDIPIIIGDNISLKYLKSMPSIKVNDRIYKNIVVADIYFGEKNYTIYFAKDNGIIGIKTDGETYKIK